MLSDLLAIVDRLIQLKEYRNKRLSKGFEKVIDPVFKDLLRIHTDYIRTFEKVYELLPDADLGVASTKYKQSMKIAESYLAEKRLELEPVRVQLRALLGALQSADQTNSEIGKFISTVADYLAFGTQGSLYPMTASSDTLQQIRNNRDGVRDYVAGILERLRLKWALVCEEYAKVGLANAARAQKSHLTRRFREGLFRNLAAV